MDQIEFGKILHNEWATPLRKLSNAPEPPSSNPFAGQESYALPISDTADAKIDLFALASTVESYDQTSDEILAQLLLLTIDDHYLTIDNRISSVVERFQNSRVQLPEHFIELSRKPTERNVVTSLFQIGLDKKYDLSTRKEALMALMGKENSIDSSQLADALVQINEEFVADPEKTIELAKLLVVDLTPRREQQNRAPYSTANSEVAEKILPLLDNVMNKWVEDALKDSSSETGILLDGGVFLHNALLLFHNHRTTKDHVHNLLVKNKSKIDQLGSRENNTTVVNQTIDSFNHFSKSVID